MTLIGHENKCVCSYTICFVLAVIVLTISIEIGAYFVYSRWYLKKMLLVIKNWELKKVLIIKQQSIELINGKNQATYIKNRKYYFYNDRINLKHFDSNLLKIDKNITKGLIFTTLDTSLLKKLMIVKIFTV